MRTPQNAHVVISNKEGRPILLCKNCKKAFVLGCTAPVYVYIEMLRAFNKEHKNCKEVYQ